MVLKELKKDSYFFSNTLINIDYVKWSKNDCTWLNGGVTIGQHEPSAALCNNGKIVAVCEEERYLRIKSVTVTFQENQ